MIGIGVMRALHGGILDRVVVGVVIHAISATRNRAPVRAHEVALASIVAPNALTTLVQQPMME